MATVCKAPVSREGVSAAYGPIALEIRQTRSTLVVGVMLALALVAPTLSGAQESAWAPRRCVSDTLTVSRDLVDTATADTVAPGLTYRCILDRRGPWLLHVVSIDLAGGRFALDGERAMGAMFGRERVSAMTARMAAMGDTALVAINADFFDLRTGEIENNHVEGGEWVKGVIVSDSPHDEFDNAHTQFAVDASGRALIGRFELAGTVLAESGRAALVGINNRPPTRPGLVLYTPRYGDRTPRAGPDAPVAERPRDPGVRPPGARRDSSVPAAPNLPQLRADSARRLSLAATREAIEVGLVRVGERGDTVLYRVAGSASVGGGTFISGEGAVLSATGDARSFVRRAAERGGSVQVVARIDGWPTAPRAVVGGWPRVLRDGENVAARADSLEGTFPRFSAGRHPRSAIALTRDSNTVMLVVVDGRRPWSVGMSLTELADALESLGAWDAMNLDGGGSSTLWVRGTIVNYPSDPSGERAVGNALVVLPRR